MPASWQDSWWTTLFWFWCRHLAKIHTSTIMQPKRKTIFHFSKKLYAKLNLFKVKRSVVFGLRTTKLNIHFLAQKHTQSKVDSKLIHSSLHTHTHTKWGSALLNLHSWFNQILNTNIFSPPAKFIIAYGFVRIPRTTRRDDECVECSVAKNIDLAFHFSHSKQHNAMMAILDESRSNRVRIVSVSILVLYRTTAVQLVYGWRGRRTISYLDFI